MTNVIVWTTNSRRLPDQTILIHPRRDRLRHIVHPRLSLEKDMDLIADRETEDREGFLMDLPQRTFGSTEFQQSFVVRTDLDVVPDHLIHRLQFELLSWPRIQIAGPVVLMDNNGVIIWWVPIGMRNEWLEKTVQLGESLASSLR
jgi:hypothetical protein